jgi:hypothetical protein
MADEDGSVVMTKRELDLIVRQPERALAEARGMAIEQGASESRGVSPAKGRGNLGTRFSSTPRN